LRCWVSLHLKVLLSVTVVLLRHSSFLFNFQTLWHCFISDFQTLPQYSTAIVTFFSFLFSNPCTMQCHWYCGILFFSWFSNCVSLVLGKWLGLRPGKWLELLSLLSNFLHFEIDLMQLFARVNVCFQDDQSIEILLCAGWGVASPRWLYTMVWRMMSTLCHPVQLQGIWVQL
jgi:hypothetical protein